MHRKGCGWPKNFITSFEGNFQRNSKLVKEKKKKSYPTQIKGSVKKKTRLKKTGYSPRQLRKNTCQQIDFEWSNLRTWTSRLWSMEFTNMSSEKNNWKSSIHLVVVVVQFTSYLERFY